MVLLLDNFDSFTYNLVDYFARLGVTCHVVRHDMAFNSINFERYKGVVLSPGPGTPKKAGIMMKVIKYCEDKLPILGVCLGHQAIGQYYGASLTRTEPVHGKIYNLEVTCPDILFANLPTHFNIVRYHSLVLQHLPDCLQILAVTSSHDIMAIKHKTKPLWGVQFHPEAIMTEFGIDMLRNWLIFNNITNPFTTKTKTIVL